MPGIDTANLGPLPFLQIAAGILVLIGFAVAVWRGIRDKSTAGSGVAPPDNERLHLKLEMAEFQGALSKVLEANREAFFKAMNDQERAMKQDMGEIEDRLRTLEIEHAGFRERLGRRGGPK